MFNLVTIANGVFDSIVGLGFDIMTFLAIAGVGIGLGFLISLTYLFIKRRVGYASDFPLSVLVIPVVVALIIYFVSDNLAGGVALGGIFALTRFRSEQKDAEDIAYIFLAMAGGLITGLGFLLPAVLAIASILVLLVVLNLTRYGVPSVKSMNLKIIVPEDINFDNLFDDILDKYCTSWHLNKVRSTDFGTMFELTFRINIKHSASQKEFTDELRTRNANLNITMVVRRFNSGNV